MDNITKFSELMIIETPPNPESGLERGDWITDTVTVEYKDGGPVIMVGSSMVLEFDDIHQFMRFIQACDQMKAKLLRDDAPDVFNV